MSHKVKHTHENWKQYGYTARWGYETDFTYARSAVRNWPDEFNQKRIEKIIKNALARKDRHGKITAAAWQVVLDRMIERRAVRS